MRPALPRDAARHRKLLLPRSQGSNQARAKTANAGAKLQGIAVNPRWEIGECPKTAESIASKRCGCWNLRCSNPNCATLSFPPPSVNRSYPPPAFLIAIALYFGKSGTEASVPALRNCMLLRHGPDNNSAPERRAMRRFSMKLPALVRVSGIPSPFETETTNVSARGIFFYIDRWMKEGSQVEVTMDFPSQVTLGEALRVRFLARVLRVVPENPSRVGVAAAIEEYEFLRSTGEGSADLQPGWSFGN